MYNLFTLTTVVNWFSTSGMFALTSSVDIFRKNPAVRSFWPMSNVYKAFEKYSPFGSNSLYTFPVVYTKHEHSKMIYVSYITLRREKDKKDERKTDLYDGIFESVVGNHWIHKIERLRK